MTNQEAFNLALFGIRNQGYKQSITSDSDSCAYRGNDNLKCGVGHCIPDELYKPEMENQTARVLMANYPRIGQLFETVNEYMLTEIQICHDHDLLGEESQRFELRMQGIADEYGLIYTPTQGE